jgi:hypothetical protein
MNPILAQARRFAALFPNNSEIAVLDTYHSALTWSTIYFRDWAADGFVAVPDCGQDSEAPVLVVVPRTGLPDDVRLILSRLSIHREFRVVAVESNEFVYHGRTLAEMPIRNIPFNLTLTGRKPITLHNVPGLPVKILAILPDCQSQRVIRLEGGPASMRFPAPAWLSIDNRVPAGHTELQIDVDSVDHRWVIRHAGQSVGWQLSTIPEPAPVQRLFVVFDRTCPDASRWSDARRLVRGHARMPGIGPDSLGGLTRAATQPPSALAPTRDFQAELNAGIRRGLADGLQEAFAPEIEVHFSWFADTAGAGLGCPTGVNLSESVCGRADAIVGSNELCSVVESATYSPGLDLWDALDDALLEVAAAARQYGPGPVLIVGNSPPSPPENPHHPFTILWRFELPRSAVRGRGRIDDALAQLDRLGCPVATVFPTGHSESSTEYQTRQGKVRQAFERVTEVFAGQATAEGIAQQVRMACQRLRTRVSEVDLRRGDE